MNFIEGGIVVTNGEELLLVSGVKKKEVKDTILHDLKASVRNQRILAFEQVGDGVRKYQGRLCGHRVDGSKRGSWRRLIAPDIPFIRVPPRCTAI